MLTKKPLAKTDVALSQLALGTVKFGRNQSVKYPTAFDLPTDSQMADLILNALDHGITTLDTAPAYGIAEQRLGEFLKKGKCRHSLTLISKAGESYDTQSDSSHYDYSIKSLEKQLENSLRTLNTDYLDVWLLHSDGQDVKNLTDEVITLFDKKKQSGLVRATGMSTKTVEGGEKALTFFDCIMMAASLDYTAENSLFDYAEDHGKSILLKKIFNSGHALTTNNKQATLKATFSTLFAHNSLCSAVIGTTNPKHLQENIDALTGKTI